MIAKSYRRQVEKLFHLYERGWVFGHPHTGDHILLHLFTQIHGKKATSMRWLYAYLSIVITPTVSMPASLQASAGLL